MTNDPVNHPSHYCQGGIETIDCIDSLIATKQPAVAYSLGNAIKYISRAGSKDPSKFVEDLNKAIWYINHAKLVHKNNLSVFLLDELCSKELAEIIKNGGLTDEMPILQR